MIEAYLLFEPRWLHRQQYSDATQGKNVNLRLRGLYSCLGFFYPTGRLKFKSKMADPLSHRISLSLFNNRILYLIRTAVGTAMVQ